MKKTRAKKKPETSVNASTAAVPSEGTTRRNASRVGVAAIVPMRHDSERVKGKNYRPLGGVPLFEHIVRTLLDCPSVGRVVIDTDSPTIKKRVEQAYPEVLVVDRPAALRDGNTPMNDVLLNTVQYIDADVYLQTHSTNPLLSVESIETAVAKFRAARGRNDSLFGVTRLQQRLWDAMANPVNHDPAVLMRTQDLTPIYVENSCLYVFTKDSLTSNGNRVGKTPMMFEIDKLEAHDIDDEADFVVAEMLYLQRQLAKEKVA
jgi:CMP-N-acetylneuraminic acid synthetase